MEKFKSVFFTFVCVTTCVVFATATYIALFWGNIEVSYMILWQILGTSFVCSFGTLIYPQKELSKKAMQIRVIIHYIYINIIVLTAGFCFGWFYVDQLPMVLGMLFVIGVVFVIISIIMTMRAKHMTKQLNDKLKELNEENEIN